MVRAGMMKEGVLLSLRLPCQRQEAGVGDPSSDVEERLFGDVLQRPGQAYRSQSHIQRVVNAPVETEA